ncbi:MAG: type II secretion system protein [Bacilli bacterium]|nr:type II secretion system protein [Bacilli bacterium]
MEKKGFTLIELLAVIVILAVIALILVPTILGIISKVKKGALLTSANGIIESATLYYAKQTSNIENDLVFNFDGTNKGTTNDNVSLSYKGIVKAKGEVTLYTNGKVSLCLNDDSYYVFKNIDDKTTSVGVGTCVYNEETGLYVGLAPGESLIPPVAIGTQWDYAYLRDAQEFIVPIDGTYKLEAWGAGAIGTYTGSYYASDNRWNSTSFPIGTTYYSYGSYAKGNVYLKRGDIIYIYTGKSRDNTGWQGTNHGGNPVTVSITWYGVNITQTTNTSSYYSSGATDFRIIKSTEADGWSGTNSLESRIVTAGGAGGLTQNGHCRADWNAGQKTYTKYGYDVVASTTESSSGVLGQGKIGYATMSSVTKNDGNYYSYGWYDYGAGGGGYYGGNANSVGTSLVKNYTNIATGINYNLTDTSTSNNANISNGYAKITYIEN